MIALWLLAACADPEVAGPVDTRWVLTWEDDFDGPEGQPPNPEVWVHDVGGDGWGNNQLEFNTDRPENASLDGAGHLVVRALREDFEGRAYTSARLTTRGTVEVGPARVEARIRVPEGKGLWPAFWMLGANHEVVGWPACGEIDILELRGEAPDAVITTAHGPGFYGGGGISATTVLAGGGSYADDFHTFAVDVDPGHLTWWIDDRRVHVLRAGDLPEGGGWVFDDPFYLILNLAVGGNFLQAPDQDTPFPAELVVDWVRVYERAP